MNCNNEEDYDDLELVIRGADNKPICSKCLCYMVEIKDKEVKHE